MRSECKPPTTSSDVLGAYVQGEAPSSPESACSLLRFSTCTQNGNRSANANARAHTETHPRGSLLTSSRADRSSEARSHAHRDPLTQIPDQRPGLGDKLAAPCGQSCGLVSTDCSANL